MWLTSNFPVYNFQLHQQMFDIVKNKLKSTESHWNTDNSIHFFIWRIANVLHNANFYTLKMADSTCISFLLLLLLLLWTPSCVNLQLQPSWGYAQLAAEAILRLCTSQSLSTNEAGVGHNHCVCYACVGHSSKACSAVILLFQFHSSVSPTCSLLNKWYFSLLCFVWSLDITGITCSFCWSRKYV